MLKTIKDVQAETGLKRDMVLMLVHEKGSKWFRLGKYWFIEETDFEAQMEKHKQRRRL